MKSYHCNVLKNTINQLMELNHMTYQVIRIKIILRIVLLNNVIFYQQLFPYKERIDKCTSSMNQLMQ